jgi:hypothetical protein
VDRQTKFGCASVVVAVAGYGMKLFVEYADSKWVPLEAHPFIGAGGLVVFVVCLVAAVVLLWGSQLSQWVKLRMRQAAGWLLRVRFRSPVYVLPSSYKALRRENQHQVAEIERILNTTKKVESLISRFQPIPASLTPPQGDNWAAVKRSLDQLANNPEELPEESREEYLRRIDDLRSKYDNRQLKDEHQGSIQRLQSQVKRDRSRCCMMLLRRSARLEQVLPPQL